MIRGKEISAFQTFKWQNVAKLGFTCGLISKSMLLVVEVVVVVIKHLNNVYYGQAILISFPLIYKIYI